MTRAHTDAMDTTKKYHKCFTNLVKDELKWIEKVVKGKRKNTP
jgi:hypothetical protein